MIKLFENELCERALIKIAQGDISALDVIYNHFGKLLYSIAYSVTEDAHLSEDILQETFLKIAEKASSYKKGTNAKAWIAAICRNLAIDKVRRRNNETAYCSAIDEDVTHIHTADDFLSLLEVLNDEERQIVILKTAWGLKHSEIAKILSITTDNARQKYKRAIEKLKTTLKEGE